MPEMRCSSHHELLNSERVLAAVVKFSVNCHVVIVAFLRN